MAKKKSRSNPFYLLLVIFGIAFSLTACAYGVMAFRAVRGADVLGLKEQGATDRRPMNDSHPNSHAPARETPGGKALLAFLDEHGTALLSVELALLALAPVGAIGTDGYWNSRGEQCKMQNEKCKMKNGGRVTDGTD